MTGKFTLPDPIMDVSECLLASMQLGVKSVSWAMVVWRWGVQRLSRLDQWGLHGSTRGAARPHQAVMSQGQAEAG